LPPGASMASLPLTPFNGNYKNWSIFDTKLNFQNLIKENQKLGGFVENRVFFLDYRFIIQILNEKRINHLVYHSVFVVYNID
jgi:hypothetical protein